MSKKNVKLLLLIPIKIVLDIAFTILGVWIDCNVLFNHNNPDVHGHGIPVFTVIFPGIAVFTTVIMIIVIIILLVRADRQSRSEDFAGRSDTNGR